jgi:cardiolipin synthase
LAAGVRVFEWNGTMLHAKTAVADGHWARVGSTNLNLASWLGNRKCVHRASRATRIL